MSLVSRCCVLFILYYHLHFKTTIATRIILLLIASQLLVTRLLPSLRKTCTRLPHLYISNVDSCCFRTKGSLCLRFLNLTTKDSNTSPATGTLENSCRFLRYSSPSFVANVTRLFQIQVPLNLSLFLGRTLHLSPP